MSTSTDGQLAFGVVLDVDEWPWEAEDGDDWEDIDEWWAVQTGFECDGDDDAYFGKRDEWFNGHPLPVELVNVCSGDCPDYMLAVPGTMISASRGYPVAIDSLPVVEPDRIKALLDFIKKYVPTEENDDLTPRWYLSGYWG